MAKSEIVKQLARGKVDTEVALKQLKLLLAEFPDEKISSWVNKELTGYKSKDELPPYRKFPGTLRGTILNYTTKASNIGIPLSPDAPKDLYEFCNVVEFRESIGALKSLLERDTTNGSLGVNVPPDYYPYIMKYSLMTMTAVLGAQVQVSSTAIPHILSEVDNRLLDIFLLLEKEWRFCTLGGHISANYIPTSRVIDSVRRPCVNLRWMLSVADRRRETQEQNLLS